MEWTDIIVAAITSCMAVVAVLIDNKRNKRLLEYRIERMERKVDLHNHYAERFANIETDIAVIKSEIRRASK